MQIYNGYFLDAKIMTENARFLCHYKIQNKIISNPLEFRNILFLLFQNYDMVNKRMR